MIVLYFVDILELILFHAEGTLPRCWHKSTGLDCHDGDAGEGGGVAGFMMVSDGGRCCGLQWLFGWWWHLLLRCSLSDCRRRSGRRRKSCCSCGLVRPLASRECRLPPAFASPTPSCSIWSLADSYGRLANRTKSFPSEILQSGEPTKVYSRRAMRSTAGITVIVIRWLDVDSSEVEGRMNVWWQLQPNVCIKVFKATRQLSHIEAAPDISGVVFLDYWVGLKRCLVIIYN